MRRRLKRTECLLAFLAPHPPTLNEGLAAALEAADNGPDAYLLELLLLVREVCLASLQFRLGEAELDARATARRGRGAGERGDGRVGVLHSRRERHAEHRVPAGPLGRRLDHPSDATRAG